MARRGTRKAGRGVFKLFEKIWSPSGHLFAASGESAQKLGTTAGKVVKESIGAVEGVGRSFARHSNMAVKGLVSRRGTRRGTRRNRRH